MLAYWAFAGLMALNIITVDPALMYSDHTDARVIAWNWSFFPIDIAFAGLGLTARFATLSAALRAKLEIVASTLMICAGLMALSYWAITGDFSATWWSMNLWLVGLGGVNLLRAGLSETTANAAS